MPPHRYILAARLEQARKLLTMTTLPIARRLLAARPQPTASAAPSPWASLLQRLTGIDLTRCPRCDRSPLDRRVLVPYAPRPPP